MKRRQIQKPETLIRQGNSSADDWAADSTLQVLADITAALTVEYYRVLSLRPENPDEAFRSSCQAEGLKAALVEIEALERKASGRKLANPRAEGAVNDE